MQFRGAGRTFGEMVNASQTHMGHTQGVSLNSLICIQNKLSGRRLRKATMHWALAPRQWAHFRIIVPPGSVLSDVCACLNTYR